MKKLENKVAIVTGASRGVGAAVAKRLAADGARVVVNYVREEKRAAEVADAIVSAGGQAIIVQADLADEAQIVRLFEQAHKEYGRLDVVVNNAALFDICPVEKYDRASFLRMVDVNLWGVLVASREAVKYFGKEGGRIINISSSGARTGLGTMTIYCATKGGVEAATRCLAAELGPRNILVNAIAPAGIDTDMTAWLPQEAKDIAAQNTPLGRMGQPDDFGGVVSFLASEDANWITGQIIPVNGGYVM